MGDDSKTVTLLKRGFLVAQPGLTSYLASELKTMIPRDYIVKTIKNGMIAGDKVYIIKSATGSGKSITLPPSLLWLGKHIALTEASRLSVEEIAHDMARKNSDKLTMGINLGYQTGIINKTPKKGIVVMTPGVLLQHFLNMEPIALMRRYSAIMIDEVHRHDIATDFLLSAVKIFLEQHRTNPECPILILMSATLQPQLYMDYFGTRQFVEVAGQSGRPIHEFYPTVAVDNLERGILQLVKKLKGDTLVFLPTVDFIQRLHKAIGENAIEVYSEILERNSELKSLQKPSKHDRVILATNAAETGVTFPHLMNVIDSGYVNTVVFNPQLNATVIFVGPISQSSAIQRRGRVGRESEGYFYPMYTREVFDKLMPDNYPEIYTQDMSENILKSIVLVKDARLEDGRLKDFKKDGTAWDPLDTGLIHPPGSEMITHCLEKLYILGFIDTAWNPTISGCIAAQFSVLTAQECRLILSAVALGEDVFHAIVIACCANVSRSKKIGQLENPDKWHAQCDFIDQLVTYEQLMNKINLATEGKDVSLRFIEDWCDEVGLNYNAWMAILELIDETVIKLMECGYPVPGWGSYTPVGQNLGIKRCILEAYRLQLATWNDVSETYVLDHRSVKLSAKSKWLREKIKEKKPPLNIVCDSVNYRDGEFTTGKFVSGIDFDFDKHFLY